MLKVLTNGKKKIGAVLFPDRKQPSLVVAEGNTITVYGTFKSEGAAERFMDELIGLVEAEEK